jgi:AcrR family transcriptional regulator
MPPQINFSKEQILNEAFEIVRKEGLEVLSARRIVQNLKCSTHPIYRAFQSMKDLETAVIEKARKYAMTYLLQGDDTQEPFLNIGLQYFRFAQEEKELFKLLYLEGKTEITFEKIGSPFAPLLERMKQDQHLQGLSEESLKRIGRDMWIYTHGLITLTYETTPQNAEEFVRKYLLQMGRTVIEWEHFQNTIAESQGCKVAELQGCKVAEEQVAR